MELLPQRKQFTYLKVFCTREHKMESEDDKCPCGDVVIVPDCCGKGGGETQDEALDLPVSQCTSTVLGHALKHLITLI